MEEIGIESTLVEAIKIGDKTIIVTTGLPKYLRVQEDDSISIREDFWYEGKILESLSHSMRLKVSQVLYFESFKEAFETVDFQAVIPTAKDTDEALKINKQFFDSDEENEYGVIAFMVEPSRD